MWETILTVALTCVVTLTVTLVFNTLVNVPKKQQTQRKEEADEIKTGFQTINNNLNVIKEGLQAVLKNELKVRYFKWLDLGYAPEDAKDDLERMYTTYHNLGANGVMDKHREKFLNLPDKPKERSKNHGEIQRMD